MINLSQLIQKEKKLVVGLMSGTSVDGIDAALTEIEGFGLSTRVKLLHFCNTPFSDEMRSRIMRVFGDSTTSAELCHLNFLLGNLFAQAVLNLCKDYGVPPSCIDLVGTHGQTIYHAPALSVDNGFEIRSTLQIGEPAVIAAQTGAVTVGNFRVADMAVMGNGAPLVPYTEYLLYRSTTENIALQNIGGIGNITLLPKDCALEDVTAFDTGPGNMVIDGVVAAVTDNAKRFDSGGDIGASGTIHQDLLNRCMLNPYFALTPPKTTGRECFGAEYTSWFLQQSKQEKLSNADMVATATAITARSIRHSIDALIKPSMRPSKLIVGGGGSYNHFLMELLQAELPQIDVITNESLGLNSDAKEAVAFAILANEAIHGQPANIPAVTGATRPVVLGCIYQ